MMQAENKKSFLKKLALCFMLAFFISTGAAFAKFKVAFIYIGPPGDLGWTYEHDRGRKQALDALGAKIETKYIENVAEGTDSARVIERYARSGFNMIIATSFGYMDGMLKVAKKYPKVYFEHCSGYKTHDNMSTYFGRMYQPRYLSGMVAGKATKTNVIGYVAAFPIPEVVRGINAFTLGVKAVNPKAVVRVVWSNTWYSPTKEKEAAVALLNQGADVISQHQDTTEPQKAARDRGVVSIGYDTDMRPFVGDSVLVSPYWNWGQYYTKTIKDAMDGTWKKHQYWGGLKEGIVALSDFSSKVPKSVQKQIMMKHQQIVDGEWDVFWGPIKDQSGKVVINAGDKMQDGAMLGMSFFVEGVIGKVK
ncbi:MAG: BMP family ABC transporter substrate-binding protein [Deltaproteobacteria bacterium]|jgi:basic membrane protein A and related proteins|nr:BMP family ABC transporter substrate-binding protein [Deltaproteobacteria bacterium]